MFRIMELKRILQADNAAIMSMGIVRCETFSKVYPYMNKYIMERCEWQNSRDGKVKELLDFKTQITNPYRRCVGGGGRNINIFFLLAEAMWIATGRKDVEFLTLFNKQMAKYSDDGKVFHAPYGYRLRHWGVASEETFANERVENKGFDQVANAVRLLAENPQTRQVVMEIWNPKFDLGHVTKDLPCNDIVMLKIRDGKLITTIGNRSNDLHWGLPTNVFQFSFLTELMATSLGVELGTQTHNSQSLHIYEWNDIAVKMLDWVNTCQRNGQETSDLYDYYCAKERHMDFNFSTDLAVNRFAEIDYHLNLLISNLIKYECEDKYNDEEIEKIGQFSAFLRDVFDLLITYLSYKKELVKGDEDKNDALRERCIQIIESKAKARNQINWDVNRLAINFFATRLSSDKNYGVL